jgi:ATP-binding cassette subfamily C protein CydCD
MRPVDPRLLPHLAPARAPLAGVVAGSVIAGLLLVGQAFAVAWLVTALVEGASTGTWDAAVRAGVLLGVVTLGRALTSWTVDVLASRASAAVTTTLRQRLVRASLALGPHRLSRRRSGEVALLLTRGVTAIDPYLTRYLPALVVAAVLPALTVVAIAGQDLLSAVIVVLTLPLVPVFAALVGLATRDRADRQWRSLASLSGHFVDVMRGLPTLVAYRRASAQSRTIRAVTDRYRRATVQTLRLAFASSAVLELVATLSVALVAVTVGLRLAEGSLGLGTALVVLLLAPEAYWPLRRVGAEFHAAAEGTATFEAADEILREADDVAAASGSATGAATSLAGAVRLTEPVLVEGLGATYPGRRDPVLDTIGLTLPTRGVTAVVGPSGCGKSTLLAALMGHLPLTGGRITVAGEPVDPASTGWRELVAWVPQRPWIAAASVRDNVRVARPDALDGEIWAALERVGLAEVVASLPGGLDAELDEDGTDLSAGERARLALARAVVAERPLVLLDEPTAHLDAGTEAIIARTITWLGERSSVVVVAHRQALVDLADQVVELPAPATATAPAVLSREEGPAGAAARPHRRPVRSTSAPLGVPRAGRWHESARFRLVVAAVLGALAAASGVALTATAGWLIVQASTHPPVLTLMVAIVGVRTFGLARPALRYLERLLSHDVALRMLAGRRASVYDVLVPLVPGRLGGRQRGDVLATIVEDVDSLLDRHLRVRAPLVTYGLVAVLAAGFATWVLPPAGLVTALVVTAGGALAFGVSRAGVARAEHEHLARRADLSATVLRTLHGAADLIMWQADARAASDVVGRSRRVADAVARADRAVATGRALALLTSGLGLVVMATVAGAGLAQGRVSAPVAALLVLLPLALHEVVGPLADAGALQVRVAAADRRLADLASLEPVVSDPAFPTAVPSDAVPGVRLRQVTAGWGESPALRDLDLDLAPGTRLGVVGPSGSGKSTLAALLMRFLDPVSGRVDLDGAPMPSLSLDVVRRRVGLVDDDPHVFASTVLENVRLARPTATAADVEQALRSAHLGPWLDRLPEGLDTLLGDGHAQVSGGERARLGMARAVLADCPVLVLDEPTAHLDSSTASAVADDLLGSTAERSVVWITHGTVGLDRVDQVLDLGRVREPAVV